MPTRLQLLVVMFFSFALSGRAHAVDPSLPPGWLDDSKWPSYVREENVVTVDSNDNEYVTLRKKHFNACLFELRLRYNSWLQGGQDVRQVVDSAERLYVAHKAVVSTNNGDIDTLKNKIAFAVALERTAKTMSELPRTKHRRDWDIETSSATSYRLGIELEILGSMESATSK